MLILAGQGNPGVKYAKNRHNAGFLLLDRIHAAHGFGPWRAKFESEVSEGAVDTPNGRVKVLLMKPQTFYNEFRPGDVQGLHVLQGGRRGRDRAARRD